MLTTVASGVGKRAFLGHMSVERYWRCRLTVRIRQSPRSVGSWWSLAGYTYTLVIFPFLFAKAAPCLCTIYRLDIVVDSFKLPLPTRFVYVSPWV